MQHDISATVGSFYVMSLVFSSLKLDYFISLLLIRMIMFMTPSTDYNLLNKQINMDYPKPTMLKMQPCMVHLFICAQI